MKLGATLYIKNTNEAVVFYQEAFGMTLGYNEKFLDGTYMLQVANKLSPITSLGINLTTESEVKKAYEFLMREGTAFREIGELPWSILVHIHMKTVEGQVCGGDS